VAPPVEKLEVANGVSVAYRAEGAGAPLLLIHGITEDHRAWDELAPALARDHRVVRVDLPGHGQSSALPEYSAQTLALPVVAFAEKLGLERPRVVGHSLGGLVATLFAALAPARSVVNVDQPLRLGGFIERVRAVAPRLRGPDFAAALDAELNDLAGPALPARIRAELGRYRVEARRPVVLGLWLPVLDQSEESLAAAFAPLLRQVEAPYLSLHGDDPGPGYAAWLRALIPSAEVEVWPGLGHWLHRVEPERFLARVRDFHART
jgi:pimeloyl-ACP methyl ester carboxylesterase